MDISTSVKHPLILNIILFQIGWWCAVLLHNHDVLWVVIGILIIHAIWVTRALGEWLSIIIISFIGISVDSALRYFDVLIFPSAEPSILCPPWLIGLWLVFSTTVGISFKSFANKRILAALLSAVGGPLSYYAGEKFGALTLGQPHWLSISILIVIWTILMPCFLTLHTFITNKFIDPNKA